MSEDALCDTHAQYHDVMKYKPRFKGFIFESTCRKGIDAAIVQNISMPALAPSVADKQIHILLYVLDSSLSWKVLALRFPFGFSFSRELFALLRFLSFTVDTDTRRSCFDLWTCEVIEVPRTLSICPGLVKG